MKNTNFNKNKIISYIVDKQLPDGGFFFAQVEPSSGYDTYCALKALRLLGSAPRSSVAVLKFWKNSFNEGGVNDLNGIFFASESLSLLTSDGKLLEKIRQHFIQNGKTLFQSLLHKKTFTFKTNETFKTTNDSTTTTFTEVVERELLELYYFVKLAKQFGVKTQKVEIKEFLMSLLNKDGGFGQLNGSQIVTTYYAMEIIRILSLNLPDAEKTGEFVAKNSKHVQYLETLFWLAQSHKILKLNLFKSTYIANFLFDCWNDNGGFRRARAMGISNLENTLYAVTLLKSYNLLDF